MDYIVRLFTGSGMVATLMAVGLAAFIGVLLGKVEVRGIRMGSAGTLFSGLLIAHLGMGFNPEILHFLKEFGLILFVYSLGIEIGPRFVKSLRSNGLKLNLLAALIVGLGFAITLAVGSSIAISKASLVGVMSGAVTNTPGLGAAQQILTEMGIVDGPADAGMAYAIAYPFGIFGIILAILAIKALFRIDIGREADRLLSASQDTSKRIESVRVEVTNANMYGLSLGKVRGLLEGEMVISRVERKGAMLVATDKLILEPDDVLYGAASLARFDEIAAKIGRVDTRKRKPVGGDLAMFHVLFTNRKLAGKTIEQIGIYRRYEANITRIFRAGIEILPTADTVVELGDTLRVVGQRELLNDIKNELGNSVRELAHPNTLPIFLGIILGIAVGAIPIFIPGLPVPAKLGLAGGPLAIAIIFGHFGRIGKFDTYMTPGANLLLRELGIILFLVCVGLSSGGRFVDSLVNGGYRFMYYGALITFIPIFSVGVLARFMKFNFLEIGGLLAGSMTDPPALEFANTLHPSSTQSSVYATVYPLTMILRILVAQLVVLL